MNDYFETEQSVAKNVRQLLKNWDIPDSAFEGVFTMVWHGGVNRYQTIIARKDEQLAVARTALEQIRDYPFHSEMLGSCMNMGDIAKDALAKRHEAAAKVVMAMLLKQGATVRLSKTFECIELGEPVTPREFLEEKARMEKERSE